MIGEDPVAQLFQNRVMHHALVLRCCVTGAAKLPYCMNGSDTVLLTFATRNLFKSVFCSCHKHERFEPAVNHLAIGRLHRECTVRMQAERNLQQCLKEQRAAAFDFFSSIVEQVCRDIMAAGT